jgi:HSP20 family protein
MLGLMPRSRVKGFVPPTYGSLAPRMELPPFLARFRDEFDKLFEPFVGLTPPVPGWRWGLEFEETDEAFVLRAEAPGFEAGDFEVFAQDGYLTLSACCKKETVENGKPVVKEEQICHERLLLPPGVIPNEITALYKNGVLFITLPRKPEAKGFKVPVHAG